MEFGPGDLLPDQSLQHAPAQLPCPRKGRDGGLQAPQPIALQPFGPGDLEIQPEPGEIVQIPGQILRPGEEIERGAPPAAIFDQAQEIAGHRGRAVGRLAEDALAQL